MAGADIHTVFIRADSSIIPDNYRFKNSFSSNRLNQSDIYNITINSGYAYTLVIKKHFFATLGAHGGVGFNYTTMTGPEDERSNTSLHGQINATLRIAAGYNSDRYFAGIHFVTMRMHSYSPIPNTAQFFDAGNLRFSFARRFKVNRTLIKKLNL